MSFPENFSPVTMIERTPLQLEVDAKLNELTNLVTQKALCSLQMFDYSTKENIGTAGFFLIKFLKETDAKLINTGERTNTFVNKMLPQFQAGIKSIMTKENFHYSSLDRYSMAVMIDFEAAFTQMCKRPDFLPTFAKGIALPLAIATIQQLDALREDIVDQLEYPDTTTLL